MHKYLPPDYRGVLTPEQLKDPERAIVEELRNGARTKGYLVEQTGYHRNTIYRGLDRLEAADIVVCLHDRTSLYQLDSDYEGLQ